MVYLSGMTQLVDKILRSPSDEFIRFLVSQLSSVSTKYAIDSKITSKVIDKFRPIIKKSIQGSLVELMTQSINKEIGQSIEFTSSTIAKRIDEDGENQNELEINSMDEKIETTVEELEAFDKIKLITTLSEKQKIEIYYKDVISYFEINVGKPNWWFVRLYLSPNKKSFVTRLSIDEVKLLAPNHEIQEVSTSMGEAASRVIISSVSDLDRLTDLILRCYETEAARRKN